MHRVDHMFQSYFGERSIAYWESERFAVAAFKDGDATRLDIVRLDAQDGITWDEMQAIKRECGYADRDAVEFYPRDSDVINTGNARHLYVFERELPFIRRINHGQ